MESVKFKSPETSIAIKMLIRLLQAIAGECFPCLAVVSWGWATNKQFKPLRMEDELNTIWATPQGSH